MITRRNFILSSLLTVIETARLSGIIPRSPTPIPDKPLHVRARKTTDGWETPWAIPWHIGKTPVDGETCGIAKC